MHDTYAQRLIGAAVALGLTAAAFGQTYEVDWYSIDGGGDMFMAAGGGFEVSGTTGQSDASDAVMTGGTYEVVGGFWAIRAPLPGDLNCDGAIDNFDIDVFVLALTSAGHVPPFDDYYAAYPDCDPTQADINGDDQVDNFDIDPFVAILTGG